MTGVARRLALHAWHGPSSPQPASPPHGQNARSVYVGTRRELCVRRVPAEGGKEGGREGVRKEEVREGGREGGREEGGREGGREREERERYGDRREQNRNSPKSLANYDETR